MRTIAEALQTDVRVESKDMSHSASSEYAQVASLIASQAARDPLRGAIVFASARAGEGTTAAVLGVASELCATYRARVLAIEFNFTRPTFTDRFHLDEDRTFGAALSSGLPLSHAVTPIATGLSVIPACRGTRGSLTDAAAAVSTLLAESHGKYDAVLIDAAPLLERSDALSLSSVAPHIVLVVEAGRTSSNELDRVRTAISSAGMEVVGAVLNKEKRVMPRWLRRWLGK